MSSPDCESHAVTIPPIAPFSLQTLVIAVVIGFTPSASLVRPGALLPIALICFATIRGCRDGCVTPFQAVFFCGGTYANLIQFIEIGLLSRWTFEAGGPETALALPEQPPAVPRASEKRPDGVLARLSFGLYTVVQYRGSGTPFEVRNLPPLDARRPDSIPSRATFLRRIALTIVLCYAVVDGLPLLGGASAENAQQSGPGPVPFFARWHEVTLPETINRVLGVLVFLYAAGCTLTMLWGVWAFLGVATGLTPVKHWKPLFGPVAEMYTVRRFWG